jgi:hypothetical protein
VGFRFEPADHREHPRAEQRQVPFRRDGQHGFALRREVLPETIFGDKDRRLDPFDVLPGFKLIGGDQPAFSLLVIAQLLRDPVIDAVLWQWVSQMPFVSRLPAAFGRLALSAPLWSWVGAA